MTKSTTKSASVTKVSVKGKPDAVERPIEDTVPLEQITRTKTGIITIPGVTTEKMTTLIVGTAPLIVNKFSEKAKQQILDAQMKRAKTGREAKDPVANFNAARHRLADGTDGVPAGGLKAAIVDGFGKDTGVFVSRAKGGIRVSPDCKATNLIRIITPHEPRMREDLVRNESGVVDIRHRPEYWPWAMLIEVEYLPTVASQGQVLQAIAKSGFTTGLCEWRPSSKESKSGTFGTWRFATEEEATAFENGTLFSDTPMMMAAE